MSWPNDLGTTPTSMQGTTLLADSTDDHSLMHRQLGSFVNVAGTVLGTTLGTALFNAYQAADKPLRHQGGTIQQIMFGTLNNGVFGTPAITSGTYNSGVFGTPSITGGTYNSANLATPTVTGGMSLSANGSITQTSTADHITLTAGASKVVKRSQVVSDNGTTSYVVGFPQYGWGTMTLTSGTNFATASTTFPVAYSTINALIVNLVGVTLSAPTAITSFTTSVKSIGFTQGFGADSVGTTGFKVSILASGNAGATTYYGYSWVAFGF